MLNISDLVLFYFTLVSHDVLNFLKLPYKGNFFS